MSRRVPGVISLLLLLPLAACGGEEEAGPADETGEASQSSPSATEEPSPSESEEPSEPTEEPDDSGGDRVEGDGYSFAGPQGWRDATDRFEAMNPAVDVGLIDPEAGTVPFSDNLNVLVGAPYPDFGLDEAEQTFLRELRNLAESPRVLPRVEIGEEDAVHLTARTPIGKLRVYTEQYAAYVDDTWYIITFSHGPDTESGDREQDMTTVLDSWEWGEGDAA